MIQHANQYSTDPPVMQSEALQTTYDVLQSLKKLAAAYQFSSFAVLCLPIDGHDAEERLIVLSNWGRVRVEEFERHCVASGSNCLSFFRDRTAPFLFRSSFDIAGEASAIDSDNMPPAGQWGLCIPTATASGDRQYVVFSKGARSLDEEEIASLAYRTALTFEILQRLLDYEEDKVSLITVREMECLRWTANGKTSSEIATILSLSEHTVNHYLNRAAAKLGASNRTHAVAKAFRQKLID